MRRAFLALLFAVALNAPALAASDIPTEIPTQNVDTGAPVALDNVRAGFLNGELKICFNFTVKGPESATAVKVGVRVMDPFGGVQLDDYLAPTGHFEPGVPIANKCTMVPGYAYGNNPVGRVQLRINAVALIDGTAWNER